MVTQWPLSIWDGEGKFLEGGLSFVIFLDLFVGRVLRGMNEKPM
jgi:hypothetical protein